MIAADTPSRVYHFLSAGTTYQGACGVAVCGMGYEYAVLE